MARGDMGYNSVDVGLGVEILNRTNFEGGSIPMTIDFSANTSTDAETGEKVCTLFGRSSVRAFPDFQWNTGRKFVREHLF